MKNQPHKQLWRKLNRLTLDDKDDVSAMSLNRKAVRSINNFDNGEPLTNAKPGRLRDQDRRLIHIVYTEWIIAQHLSKESLAA